MLIGLVKWFDQDKGFGVVANPEEGEFFLHINNFAVRPQAVSKLDAIVFAKRIDKKKNRNSAEECRMVGDMQDWGLIMSYIDKPDILQIEVDVLVSGRRGTSHREKQSKSYSLMNMAARKVFAGKSNSQMLKMILDYYDEGLNKKYFISYCNLIEKNLAKRLEETNETHLSHEIYSHFGKNLTEETLFLAWKQRKFNFIGYTAKEEYEIPENVLWQYYSEIGAAELKRILIYSFGPSFCNDFVNKKLATANFLKAEEINYLYPFLEFIHEEKREKLKTHLDELFVQKTVDEILCQANNLDPIKEENDLYKYTRLNQSLPKHISDSERVKIKDEINKIIERKCSDEFKPQLWLKGVINSVPFAAIKNLFFHTETTLERRTAILSKLAVDQQFALLKIYSVNGNWEESFKLLENFLVRENSLGYGFELSQQLYNSDYWGKKKGANLLNAFIDFLNQTAQEHEKYELFFKGLVKNISPELVLQNLEKINPAELERVFKNLHHNVSFILNILMSKVSEKDTTSLEWIYALGKRYLDNASFTLLDQRVFESVDGREYFKLWREGKTNIVPKDYINNFLADNYESFMEIDNWIHDGLITKEDISNFLLNNLREQTPVNDRIIFYRKFNRVKYLLNSDDRYQMEIKEIGDDYCNILLWFLAGSDFFDFDNLKTKFIYFSPEDQVKIIRMLFRMKVKNKFALTVDKLEELVRVDLDLYRINLSFNPSISLDISTDVIIKALKSFQEKGKFLVESELISVVLNDLRDAKTRRFKLESYFENCKGRGIAKFNWDREGEIEKKKFGNNQFYFAISFPTGETESTNTRWGSRAAFRANPNFENLKKAVKKLPKSKWNPEEKHWGVPAQYENEVLAFAKTHRFFLNFEGSKYVHNTHLAEFKRAEIPNGISFCEGRLANKPDDLFKKPFWWCTGQKCFEKCETIHTSSEWDSYTLLDFCEILGLNTDEQNRMGDFIPKGNYYQFIGLINRFNLLLERLYCEACNEILHPVDTAHFAAHTVVRFHCVNNSCSNKDEIYLNHCLNGQCNSIIDSRVSQKCPNGLFICSTCGSCCSHEMLKRRLNNLQTVGGYIHPNLIRDIQELTGHLERAEYFCYKCKKETEEINAEVFYCKECDVKYDTAKYKFKRPHKHLRKRNTTGAQNDEGGDLEF